MGFLKENIRLLIGIVIGILLTGGVVYAVTSASDVTYTRSGTNITNVEAALNDLYTKSQTSTEIKTLFNNGQYYNQDKIEVVLTGCSVVSNKIQITTTNYRNTN